MRMTILKAALAGVVLSISGFANAGLIDFNSMANGVYSGNSDFIVTTYGGPESDASLTPIIRYNSGITYLCNSSDTDDTACTYPTEDIIDFDFNIGIDSLILSMYWAGDPSVYGSTGVTVNSYDISGNILQSFGYKSAQASIYVFDSVSDIYSIQTNSNLTSRSNWWYGINSIDYTVSEVPEPSTIAIFALAIMGLASRRTLLLKNK